MKVWRGSAAGVYLRPGPPAGWSGEEAAAAAAMARLVAVCRDGEEEFPFEKRQIPLYIDDTLTVSPGGPVPLCPRLSRVLQFPGRAFSSSPGLAGSSSGSCSVNLWDFATLGVNRAECGNFFYLMAGSESGRAA